MDYGEVEVLSVEMEEGMETHGVFREDKVMKEIVLRVIEDETWQSISNMLDCEEVFGEYNTTFMKVMPTLEYDKHQIFKATLVSQLNADPISSKDRLT